MAFVALACGEGFGCVAEEGVGAPEECLEFGVEFGRGYLGDAVSSGKYLEG